MPSRSVAETTTPDDVLDFWLGPESDRDAPRAELSARWWKQDPAFDEEIRRTFGTAVAAAGRHELDAWTAAPRGRLALVILLDQLTRNVHRGSARMYENDAQALSLAIEALDAGGDEALRPAERYFLYMPLMHAEDLAVQERCVRCFERLARQAPRFEDSVSYARRHRDIVARFGRFPHRNRLLGRATTSEEAEFLEQPGSSF